MTILSAFYLNNASFSSNSSIIYLLGRLTVLWKEILCPIHDPNGSESGSVLWLITVWMYLVIMIPTSAGWALVLFQNAPPGSLRSLGWKCFTLSWNQILHQDPFCCQMQHSSSSVAKVDHQFWHWSLGGLLIVWLEINICKGHSALSNLEGKAREKIFLRKSLVE